MFSLIKYIYFFAGSSLIDFGDKIPKLIVPTSYTIMSGDLNVKIEGLPTEKSSSIISKNLLMNKKQVTINNTSIFVKSKSKTNENFRIILPLILR